MGEGDIRVDGPGTVSFEGNDNIFRGNTIIDSGSQGPGVVRVLGTNSLGSVGQVIIGEGGNNTTGRLELANNSSLANAIRLSGRNNDSVGIQNISGNNTISGAVRVVAGGTQYRIESSDGTLTLDGTNSGGVAMSSLATGNRTFTLQGQGNGIVTGRIMNGNGTTSIRKEGSGTWEFSGNNSYAGVTLIVTGTLLVNGVHTNGGNYHVHAEGTLGGSGNIRMAAGREILVDGIISPGNSIGTLVIGSDSIFNSVVFRDGSELVIEVGAGGISDQLLISGELDLSSNHNSIRLVSLSGGFDGSSYLISTFTPGSLNGHFFNHIYLDDLLIESADGLLGNGYQLVYQDHLGQISLIAIPEPSLASGFLIILAGLSLRRRRD